MYVSREAVGNVLILRPEGKLDGTNSAELESVLAVEITGGANQILLDFSALDYISSSGLRVIIASAKQLKRQEGLVALCQLNEHIQKVFKMSGFDTILAIETTRESALAAFF